jgi:hypothetical protein
VGRRAGYALAMRTQSNQEAFHFTRSAVERLMCHMGPPWAAGRDFQARDRDPPGQPPIQRGRPETNYIDDDGPDRDEDLQPGEALSVVDLGRDEILEVSNTLPYQRNRLDALVGVDLVARDLVA